MEDWRKKMEGFFNTVQGIEERTTLAVSSFYSTKVEPAFEKLKVELEKYGREVNILKPPLKGGVVSSIEVRYNNKLEFSYTIKVKVTSKHACPYIEVWSPLINRTEVRAIKQDIRGEELNYDVSVVSEEEIIEDFVQQFISSGISVPSLSNFVVY